METKAQKEAVLAVQDAEWEEYIKIRRIKNGLDSERRDTVGLGLSGGGIRSASFNLGFLQALEKGGYLKCFDYMSTVSGGGYIGASLSWLMAQPGEFSFGRQRKDNLKQSGDIVAWIREHGNYLTPGHGITFWSLISAIFMGILVNLIVLVPFFLLLFHCMINLKAAGLVFTCASAISLLVILIFFPFQKLKDTESQQPETDREKIQPGFADKVIGFFEVFRYKFWAWPMLVVGLACLAITYAKCLPFGCVITAWLDDIFNCITSTLSAGNETLKCTLILLFGKMNLFSLLNIIGVVCLVLFLLFILWQAMINGDRNFLRDRKNFKIMEKLLSRGVFALLFGTIPLIHGLLQSNFPNWYGEIKSAITLSGILELTGAWITRYGKNETRGLRAFLLYLGMLSLIYGLFLWFYVVADCKCSYATPIFSGLAFFSLIFAVRANINNVSMHRFYRDRLMEAFFPFEVINKKPEEADDFRISDLAGKGSPRALKLFMSPYHLINTTLLTINSRNDKLRLRGGENFILSPLYCGSQETAYVRTKEYVGNSMDLATAMAISGAAVDPNMYVTKSRPLSFIMSLLNVRLGYWIRNPKKPARKLKSLSRPPWFIYIFREMFGMHLDENTEHVHLADGGHFSQFGLYELIKRKCKLIVFTDASADPDFTFWDLARIVRLARVDFGAEIKFASLEPLIPDGKTQTSQNPYILGTISYQNGPEPAWLVYVKTCYFANLPADVQSYKKLNPDFPDQSTLDQFFDEAQFEAYRELGYQTGQKLVNDADFKKYVNDLFPTFH